MNTQVLHCRFKTSTDDAAVYELDEKLKSPDLVTILANNCPVVIIIDGAMQAVTLPSVIGLENSGDEKLGVALAFTSIVPGSDNPATQVMRAMNGARIMDSVSGVTDLIPELVYLVIGDIK